MALSPDVIVTALQELIPGYQETWTKFHPAFDMIVDRGQKSKAKHPYKEFGLVPEGPGTLNDVGSDPDKFLVGGRRQSAVKGNTYAATLIYVYDIPNEDLRKANGEADVIGLLKKYPERALMDFHEIIARQLVMGGVSGAESFFTLNGDANYNPSGLGSRQGLLEFAEATAQTGSPFGVTRNSIVGWHNQYAHITSMGGDGLKKMRKAYWDASQQGASASDGNVDLMLGDRDSFDNYIDELVDFVWMTHREADVRKGDPAPKGMRKGVAFQDATFYPEPYIVRADFSTSEALDGVIYGLHTADLYCYTQGTSEKETGGDFDHRGPIRLPHQDMYRYELVLSMGLFSDNLRRHFAVTGGATP